MIYNCVKTINHLNINFRTEFKKNIMINTCILRQLHTTMMEMQRRQKHIFLLQPVKLSCLALSWMALYSLKYIYLPYTRNCKVNEINIFNKNSIMTNDIFFMFCCFKIL